jgi:hypothetical protein
MIMKHLKEDVKLLAEGNDDNRLTYIHSDFWIPYTRANEIIRKFQGLMKYPRRNRMPNFLVVGETNNGKTALLNKFQDEYNPYVSPELGTQLDVLMIETPPSADESRLYHVILDKLMAPYRVNDRVDKKHYQVMQLFGSLNLKMLIIDELHSIISGSYNKQRAFLTILKYLSNELKIVIVAAGTKEAVRVINTDPQLANRFDPIILQKWKMNEDFLRLLMSFESLLPLREKSNLIEKELSYKILAMSEGTIGEVSRILKEAAVVAIENGYEKITLKTLDHISYISPSRRKREIESL